jgi:hypothetical protein
LTARRCALAALIAHASAVAASAQRLERTAVAAVAGPVAPARVTSSDSSSGDAIIQSRSLLAERSTPSSPMPFAAVIRSEAGAEPAWWTPLASMALPGTGQALLSQDRFVGYLAVEGYAWVQYATDVRDGRRERDAYRALANRVARRYFPDPKPTGGFEYYEEMEHYIESGVYDQFPGGDVEPETDTLTFNGAMWLLARRTYWEDPNAPPPPGSAAYENALQFYERRAVPPEFRWSWRNAQLEQDLFRRTIARSNAAFRRSIQDLGIVIANHALSTVDAYVALRLRRRVGPGARGYDVSASIPWAPFARPTAARARR